MLRDKTWESLVPTGKNMNVRRGLRALAGIGAIAAAGALLLSGTAEQPVVAAEPVKPTLVDYQDLQKEIARNGEIGFVVTEIAYALGPDAKDSGNCPNGMTRGIRDVIAAYAKTPAGLRREGETDQLYQRRILVGAHTAPNGQNICLHPEAAAADPDWRSIAGPNRRADGIDLDGQAGGKRPAAGTCGHENFQGLDGQAGVDNQFYRVVGCTPGFQSTGAANGYRTEMYTGAWGVLVRLRGVDDLRNDPEVEVGIYGNADPIALSAARAALPFATYAADQNPRYRATARGRIVNGVLTMDPVDLRIRSVVNAMIDERVLRDARLKLTFNADGTMDGYLAGYAPVEDLYSQQFGNRLLKTADGNLASEARRIQVAQGREDAFGHSCNGVYYALRQAADGHPDASGHCTSISTQYRIRVAPAYVVDAKTRSVNDPLVVK